MNFKEIFPMQVTFCCHVFFRWLMIIGFDAKITVMSLFFLLSFHEIFISQVVLLSDFIKVWWEFRLSNIKENLTSIPVYGHE